MLEMKDVCLKIGKKQLFNALSFVVKEGDTFCISGEQGCGKTSVLRMVMGMLLPNSGYITMDYECITPLSASYFRQFMS
ncbi:MAG TPA: ATP-binding cassette domain-containing protein, partial [Prevotella sp.]